MAKLKKALKKQALTKNSRPDARSVARSNGGPALRAAAQPAKKASSAKRKSEPLPAKKAGAVKKKAGEKAVAKKAAAVDKKKLLKKPAPAAAKKVADKAEKGKKAAPAKPAPPKKAAEKAVERVAERAPEKAVEKKLDKTKGKAEEPREEKALKARKGEERPRKGAEEVGNGGNGQASAEAAEDFEGTDQEVILTDAEGRRYCRVKDCDQIAMVDTYCRYHYLLFWKKIQVRKKILSEGKLERYIEELTARYPDKYLEMLRKDLRSEKDFMAAIHELEIDEASVDTDYEDEAQSFIEEVRGMSGDSPAREDEEY